MSRKHKKNNPPRKSELDLLREWQLERLERDRELPLPAYGPSEVTLLTYFFPRRSEVHDRMRYSECAIREAWRRCGFLRTVIVVNQPYKEWSDFAAPFNGQVEIQVEPSLIPGNLDTMSADCNGRLPARFHTPYVLLVADDAFPIRPGLGTYLEDGDFIGAPLPAFSWWKRLRDRFFNCLCMSGAISLRSRALASRAAEEWRMRYADKAMRPEFHQGRFATEFLPTSSFSYRKTVRFPSRERAASFSYDGKSSLRGHTPPFSFAGAHAFHVLLDSGKYDL